MAATMNQINRHEQQNIFVSLHSNDKINTVVLSVVVKYIYYIDIYIFRYKCYK